MGELSRCSATRVTELNRAAAFYEAVLNRAIDYTVVDLQGSLLIYPLQLVS